MNKPNRQTIRYLRTADGVRLAWADAGSGLLLVKAANWLTHLEYDWESPVWRHWIRFLAGHFRFVRYDERGCGLTDREVDDLSHERKVSDLDAVVDAAGAPVTLLGISQGAAVCVEFAARHPGRVSGLVLYGGYSRGVARRANPQAERVFEAIVEMARVGWDTKAPVFRQVFTSWFLPGGTDEQLAWYNELCRKTIASEMAARLLESLAHVDVTDALARVKCPTLVLHARRDAVVPFEEGRRLAAGIPGAQFVELGSRNHVLLENEPAWTRFCEAVLDFAGLPAGSAEDPAFSTLSAREREVLGLVTEGLGNAEIAERLGLREKTVRNHVTNLFDKLGVWTRAQAIVFARDRGFRLR
jgi:pimeloyl-ACP methyl ester carboxylesterase/DNA-binding CsgD family transcriptional regulator